MNPLSPLARLVFLGLTLGACIGKDFSVAQSAANLKALPANAEEVRIRGIANADVQELARFQDVKHIDLTGGWKALPMRMTSAGFSRLADLKLPRVNSIGLNHCPSLDDECLRHVARIPSLTMVTLNDSTGYSQKGLAFILALPHLTYLDLRGCVQVDDAWVETLAKCRTLTQLGVTATKMTPAGVGRLREALPNCHVDDEVAYIEAALDRALYPGWGGPPERKGR